MSATISTGITDLFQIKHPVILAGMNQSAGPDLVAAVTNAGGLGVLGGVTYTPDQLRELLQEVKSKINGPEKKFGVDLLLPKVGKGARKTNKDYTEGNLEKLVDIIIEEKASLFVSAVGLPPKWVVDKFHKNNIPVMNMIGHPKHAIAAMKIGVDLVCAQGTEAGGHTGDIATSVLIPQVVDVIRNKKSSFTGKPVMCVAAGGIYDGRGLAMALSLGAEAVWVGTRFVASAEGGAPMGMKKMLVAAKPEGTTVTPIFTGRPMRVLQNDYIKEWQTKRAEEARQLQEKGTIPAMFDVEQKGRNFLEVWPKICGQAAGGIHEILPAKEIVENFVKGAVEILQQNATRVSKL
eukprot:gene262-753_t